MTTLKITVRAAIVLSLIALANAVAVADPVATFTKSEAPVYWLSVVPQYTKLTIHRDWTPLTEYLSAQTGLDVRLRLYGSIPQFETSLLNGEPEIAYMNPYHAVMAHDAQAYVPIVRDNAQVLTGILVVRTDSAYHTAADLEGRVISFPSPNAFAASLLMRAILTNDENITFATRYDVTHSNTYRQVLIGNADAGGAVQRTLEKQRPEVRNNLRVVFQTPPTTPHPIGVHPRVPIALRNRLRDALLDLRNSEMGRSLLSGIAMDDPIDADYARDYAALTALNLDAFVEPTNH